MYQFTPKYKILQTVYHITPESDEGVIIDISYKVSTDEIQYLVALGFNNEMWCLERELSSNKIFN